MVRSAAATVDEYLESLPAERRKVVAAVRKVILENLPTGYEERMNWGMISYEVPLERFPKTYNGQPLMYAALAAQKNNYSLHLMCLYMNSDLVASLKAAFEKIGKKLDMGKACIRFRRLEDLPLDAIGKLVARVPVDEYLRRYMIASVPGTDPPR
jgi:uncharacterized protein YdhG (YjbR/CyaY superfamily)